MLKYRNPGYRNSSFTLEAAAFTKLNYIAGVTQNNRLSADTPKGVLGGSVAGLAGSYVAGAGDATRLPLGLFFEGATSGDFKARSPVASNKITVFMGSGSSYEVDVYETHEQDGPPNTPSNPPLTYAVGDALFCTYNGLLTNQAVATGIVNTRQVAYLVKTATATDPFIGVILVI